MIKYEKYKDHFKASCKRHFVEGKDIFIGSADDQDGFTPADSNLGFFLIPYVDSSNIFVHDSATLRISRP